ncbi:hypothetical protein QN379_00500 [Glaciimonas sp. Gout2]|uniref:hypothetical protein n=1 Tax=unclassified Glaciimonas TaxID=2644401 RepID=UPI002B22248B|nr:MULTISPECIES: hypothetical protein [unclassified Glaciimonas]MEB0012316.1 hypothetical protein [Glaciimonas sp. Cout2]MEB0080497.1 hypothetical protein [Glaciimonas sp. Gout2]
MKKIALVFFVIILCSSQVFAESIRKYQGTGPNVELRISVDGRVFLGEREMEKIPFSSEEEAGVTINANTIPIISGKNVQVTVEMIEADGLVTDVTNSPNIIYNALGKVNLKANKSGLVTAISEKNILSLGEVFVIYNTSEKSGYNKIFFKIAQPEPFPR